MTIDTKQPILQLNGKPFVIDEAGTILTLGEAIAECLGVSDEGGKHKIFILARKFYEGDVSGIDKADMAMTKNVIERTKRYNAIIAGQIIDIIDEAQKETK